VSCMKKADVELRYDRGNYYPTINVRHHFYVPDIIRKFADVTAESKHLCATCGESGHFHRGHTGGKRDHRFVSGGTHHVHEFGDDTAFWGWLDSMDDRTDSWDYPNGALQVADSIAREIGWEDAHEAAYEVWGSKTVQIYGDGRSGGWLVVRGLGEVEDWDAIELARWTRFTNLIKDILDGLDYSFAWHAKVNVHDNWLEQLQEAI